MAIENLPKNSIVIFREYNLDQPKKQVLALKIKKICKKLGHKLIIGKDFNLAKKIKADGVHFSDNSTNSWLQINKKMPNFVKTLACHSLKSVIKAKKSKVSALFFSPVFYTKSHKNAKIMGLRNLAKSVGKSKKPVFALGGINQKNISSIQKVKSNGVAGIDLFGN